MKHKLIVCALFIFTTRFLVVASSSAPFFKQTPFKNNTEDSLRKKKVKNTLSPDFENNEYTHIGDKYNKFCERLVVNSIADGYTDRQSYNPGDTVKLYLSSAATIANHKIYICDVLMNKVDSLTCFTYSQTPSAIKPWENYGYTLSTKYVIPANVASGMYNVGKAVFFYGEKCFKKC